MNIFVKTFAKAKIFGEKQKLFGHFAITALQLCFQILLFPVLRSRIIIMRLWLRVKIFMRLVPYR
jgi:hypothetical protein